MSEISLTGDQMLVVLEMIARHGPVSASDIARLCKINRTVAYRLISTLWKRNYIRQTPTGFVLGQAILWLCKCLDQDIARIVRPLLDDLANSTGETAVLHCVDRDEAIVAAQALGDQHVVRVQHVPGTRHPLISGAGGWALLSSQDDAFVVRILKKHGCLDNAWKRVIEVRTLGFAVTRDELKEGVHGLAVSILVPSLRVERLERYLPKLSVAAKAVWTALVGTASDVSARASQVVTI